MTLSKWEQAAWEVLAVEMTRRKITYKELARRLEAMGINESAAQLTRKVNRHKFSAAFMLACMTAMGAEQIPLPSAEQQGQGESK